MRRGFGAMVGNPPFLGGKRISTVHGAAYRDWLAEVRRDASSNTDLCAYFLRDAFERVRRDGAFGFIATNTIAQGDTRTVALGWILDQGGEVYAATTRYRWPDASVVVSVVHLRVVAQGRGEPATLDGRKVRRITAFLAADGLDAEPARLPENRGKSFIGCFLRGMGFTFADRDPAATPLSVADRLIADDPRNADRIRPFLGGAELNATPDQAPTRRVIDFSAMTLDEARRYPELLAIVEAKVKPERDRLGSSPADRAHKARWWRFANERAELAQARRGMSRMIATARVSRSFAFAFVPTSVVPSDQLVLFAFDRPAALAVLQSRVHEVWARRFSSTFGEGLRYTPSDAFETFPWPADWRDLDEIGAEYDAQRARVLRETAVGLTALYRRFHDPSDRGPDVEALRALHAEMDEAVLRALGLTELNAMPSFCDDGSGGVRLQWSDGSRDDVLCRLRALNAARAVKRP